MGFLPLWRESAFCRSKPPGAGAESRSGDGELHSVLGSLRLKRAYYHCAFGNHLGDRSSTDAMN
jgi:hypothetical protein